MENMNIPRSLGECMAKNPVSEALCAWAEGLKRWGKILLCVLVLIGIVEAVVSGMQMYDIDEEMAFGAALSTLESYIWYAIIEFFTYKAIALLLTALANIVQNTTVTAKVALYNAAKQTANSAAPLAKAQEAAGEQKTVQAEKDNPVSAQAAAENSEQKEEMPVQAPEVQITEDGNWICPGCKRKNLAARSDCWACGAKRQ